MLGPRTGDVHAILEDLAMRSEPENPHDLLASHAGGLRALAFDLVGDPHAAEDVLQDAFVRVLSKSDARAASAGGARAFLRTIVRGLASNHRRDAAHRAEREAAYARDRRSDERATTPFDAHARGEALQRVVAAVLALEEPYKTAVLLRYFEGLGPAEIAERTNAPLATVASRLLRAHQKLRAELERGGSGLVHALAPLLGAAWTAKHAGPLAAAERAVRVGDAAGTSIGKGIVLMGTKSLVAAGALVLALLCWWLLAPSGDAPLASAPVNESAPRAAAPSARVEDAPPEVALPAGPARAAAVATAARPSATSASAPLASDGPGPFEFELELAVVDAFGFPAPGVQIDAAPDGQPLADFGLSGWNGKLLRKWRGFEPALDLVVRAQGRGGNTDLRHVRVAAGTAERATLALDVVLEDGVDASSSLVLTAVLGSGGSSSVVFRALGSGESSEFELDAHGNGVWEDPFLWAPEPKVPLLGDVPVLGRLFQSSGTIRLSGERIQIEGLALDRQDGVGAEGARAAEPETFTVHGRVRTPSGAAAANVQVTLLAKEGSRRLRATTDESGEYAFEGCRAGPAVVCAGGPGAGFVVRELALTATSPALDLALEERGNLFVRLVDETGAPLSGWRVEAWADERAHDFVRSAKTGEDGRALLYGVGAAPLALEARPESETGPILPAKRVAERVWAQKDELAIVVEGGKHLARVELVLASATGRVADEGVVRLERGDGVAAVPVRARDEGEGAAARRVWSLAGLVPGSYRLVAGAPGEAWTDLGPIELRAGDALALGERRFAPRARAAVVFAADAEPAAPSASTDRARASARDVHAADGSAEAPSARERADARFFARRRGAIVRSRSFDLELPGEFGIPTGEFRLEWTRRAALASPPPTPDRAPGSDAGSVQGTNALLGGAEDDSPPPPAFEAEGKAETHVLEGRAGATTKLELAPKRP